MDKIKNISLWGFILFLILSVIALIIILIIYIINTVFTDSIAISIGILGFIGAILGGIISGMLTLKGVNISIEENRRKDLEESLPKKLFELEDIISILNNQYELLLKTNNYSSIEANNFGVRERVKYIMEYLEEDGLLRKSAEINIDTYRIIKELHTFLNKISQRKEPVSTYPVNEVRVLMCNMLEKLNNERDNIVKRIEDKENI